MEALEGAVPQQLQAWRAHGAAGEITCCAVSGDGARLLTGGGDRSLRTWRWLPSQGWSAAAAAVRAHRYGLTACCWSPRGALAASGGVDGAARVWAAADLRPRRLLAAPAAPALRALAWAGTAVLLCGYDDGSACVWHVPRAELRARVHAHEGALHALGALADGALLLTACTDGVLKVFDLQEVVRAWSAGEETPSPLMWEDGAHDMGALCCAVSSDGRRAATGGHDARVRLWALRGGGGRGVAAGPALGGHGAAVTALHWAGTVLASAALDRTARLWSAAGACLLVLHAHPRYLTCVALAPDLSYLITGSNDKSVRMWALGKLNIDDELEPPCEPLAHFGVGDLEGIGPVDDEALLSAELGAAAEGEAAGAARLVWRDLETHSGAVNCLAVRHPLLATACSDGVARLFRWEEGSLRVEGELGARGYPALAADFSAGGGALLVAGLDGAARLWDVESGCMLRSLCVAAGEGGGGVRGARLSAQRPARVLLITDDSTAPMWSLADADPDPLHVFEGPVEGGTCCAWSSCGRLAALGGAGGELRLVLAEPPRPMQCVADAHELAVQSCDFAPPAALDLPPDSMLLATVGCDELIKLWRIDLDDVEGTAVLRAACSARAHGGGASAVRWGRSGGRLVSGGADGWARLWVAAAAGGDWRLRQLAAVPARGAAGVAAVALLEPSLLALGSLAGELAVWRLAEEVDTAGEGGEGDEEGGDQELEPRWWGAAGVARWLREYVTRAPDVGPECLAAESRLLSHAANMTGVRLLDEPLDQLLEAFGYGKDDDEEQGEELTAVRRRLLDELQWLRRGPPPEHLRSSCPHWLQCPLGHGVQREPARAADGVTYDRAALHEWFLAADGAVSAISSRVLCNARVTPNYRARDALRNWLQENDAYRPYAEDTD